MNALRFRQALEKRQLLFGTLIVSPSPAGVTAPAVLDLDYVFLDTEHVPIDRQTLAWMCQAYEGADLAPLVRIPSPEPCQAGMVLDGGAAAVLARRGGAARFDGQPGRPGAMAAPPVCRDRGDHPPCRARPGPQRRRPPH